LLEAKGYRAGAYSSMHACATKAGNPIRPLIEQALPDYFEWFADFRDIRNHMKLGAWTAFGFRGSVGSTQMRVILQNVDDAKRYVSSGRESSLVDVSRCLTQSARLLQFAADVIGHTAQAESRARPNKRIEPTRRLSGTIMSPRHAAHHDVRLTARG
jgi:hypothetical protein